MFSDIELKKIIENALTLSISATSSASNSVFKTINSSKSKYKRSLRNKLRSSIFVSNLGKSFEKYYPVEKKFNTSYISVNDSGQRMSGEWITDISVSNRHDIHGRNKSIDTDLIWAIESESSTSWQALTEDLRKILVVHSQNYLYLNGQDQKGNYSKVFRKERLRSVQEILAKRPIPGNFYFGFWPSPKKGDSEESIWTELNDNKYLNINKIFLYKFINREFVEIT